MPPEQMKELEAQYAAIAQFVGNSLDPHFVTPLTVYLASENCKSTHAIYSATWGRYARAFIGMGDGWCGPRDVAPTADDIAAHWNEISARERFCVPTSLEDEFAEVVQLLAA